jgi:hypothetical protein
LAGELAASTSRSLKEVGLKCNEFARIVEDDVRAIHRYLKKRLDPIHHGVGPMVREAR